MFHLNQSLCYLTALLLIAPSGIATADELPSYKQSLEQHIEKSKNEKSPFSASDMAAMENAGKNLPAVCPPRASRLVKKRLTLC